MAKIAKIIAPMKQMDKNLHDVVNSSVEVAYFGTENYWSKFILNGYCCEAKFNFQMDTRCRPSTAAEQ